MRLSKKSLHKIRGQHTQHAEPGQTLIEAGWDKVLYNKSQHRMVTMPWRIMSAMQDKFEHNTCSVGT